MQMSTLIIQAITIFFYILQAKAQGISCYRCVVSYSDHDASEQLCSQFDGSAKFQVYCPTSTMCMKKTIYYKSQKSIIKAEQRDCALQKNMYKAYNYHEKKWDDKIEIDENAYEEGCNIGEARGSTAGPPEYCFCGFHLCNSSLPNGMIDMSNIIVLISTFLFICIFYL